MNTYAITIASNNYYVPNRLYYIDAPDLATASNKARARYSESNENVPCHVVATHRVSALVQPEPAVPYVAFVRCVAEVHSPNPHRQTSADRNALDNN